MSKEFEVCYIEGEKCYAIGSRVKENDDKLTMLNLYNNVNAVIKTYFTRKYKNDEEKLNNALKRFLLNKELKKYE